MSSIVLKLIIFCFLLHDATSRKIIFYFCLATNYSIICRIIYNLHLLLSSTEFFGKCFTPNQYFGDCVYVNQCPELNAILQKPFIHVTHQERWFLSLSQCGFFDRQPLVCCQKVQNNGNRQVTTPSPVPSTASTRRPTNPTTSNSNNNNINLLPKSNQCGIDASNRSVEEIVKCKNSSSHFSNHTGFMGAIVRTSTNILGWHY